MSAKVLALTAGLWAASCQVLTDFELRSIEERSDALCTDERDNDFNGFADCQDWSCERQLACCDIPQVILEEDFGYGAVDPGGDCSEICQSDNCPDSDTCNPDPAKWYTWGCPFAKVCNGELRIDKDNVGCFAAGTLSRPFPMTPGMRVALGVYGPAEQRGRITLSLTVQDEDSLPGSNDPCSAVQQVTGFASVTITSDSDGGFLLSGELQGQSLGELAVPAEPESDRTLLDVVMRIDIERRLSFEVNGVEFAKADRAIPERNDVRLVIDGLTKTASVDYVSVSAGLRCHAPNTWSYEGSEDGAEIDAAYVLLGSGASDRFDDDEVFAPHIDWRGREAFLYYTGCQYPAGETVCIPQTAGIGLARLTENGAFVREDRLDSRGFVAPLLGLDDFSAELSGSALDWSFEPADVCDSRSPTFDSAICQRQRAALQELASTGPAALRTLLSQIDDPAVAGYLSGGGTRGVVIVLRDSQGAFYPAEALKVVPYGLSSVDFAQTDGSVVVTPSGQVYFYFTNNNDYFVAGARTSRIGLTVSSDGVHFERLPEPVLEHGFEDSFDADSVAAPSVVYDSKRQLYRMWYAARDFFGVTSIGYAISLDGIDWHRYPTNPVLSADAFGLQSVGGPDVVLRDDGRLFLFVDGFASTDPRRRILLFENSGALSEVAQGPELGP